MSNTNDDARIGLVLGAGGSAGGMWTRGCFSALERATGFQPSMSTELVGTSIGAFIAARIERGEPASPSVFGALLGLATVPASPSPFDRALTLGRVGVGRLICLIKPPGRDDPRSWVEQVEPTTIARVVSARCRNGVRRITPLVNAASPADEIAASGAVPIGAKPVVMDGAGHIDGAVLSVTNADEIDPATVDLLIVIAPLVSTGPGGSLLSSAGRRQLRCELAAASAARLPVMVFAPTGHEYEHRQERERHKADAEGFLDRERFTW